MRWALSFPILFSIGFGDLIHFAEESRLHNVRQLTFGGVNTHPRFSADGRFVTFQAHGGDYGTECDQIYRLDLCHPGQRAFRLSTGIGGHSAASFFPDNSSEVFASTFHRTLTMSLGDVRDTCPTPICLRNMNDPILRSICATAIYLYELDSDYDLFTVNNAGNIKTQLTKSSKYNAEAVVSPNGDFIVFTSLDSGDPDLWIMNATDGSNRKQLTKGLGYDGDAAFSPDGGRLVYRASHPLVSKDVEHYIQLMKYNLVEPTQLELFTLSLNGGDPIQITRLGGANWSPSFHPDGKRILFASNHNRTNETFGSFDLFLMGENGKGLERVNFWDYFKDFQITFNPNGFDSFPHFHSSSTGQRLVWASSRNSTDGDVNLFIADFVENGTDHRSAEEFQNCPTLPNSSKHFLRKHKSRDYLKEKRNGAGKDSAIGNGRGWNFGPKSEWNGRESNELHFPDEKHLDNVVQLTFGGQNAEGYFSFDDNAIVLQAAGVERYGTECDQIYTLRLDQFVTPDTPLQRLSTGLGVCTCSYFFPDNRHSIHAATFVNVNISDVSKTCPPKKCQSPESKTDPILKKLCNTSYTWDLFPDYDIYKVNEYGNFVDQLTDYPGYDAEAAISPDGKRIVFTSMRTGDPELWLMDSDGGNLKQLTNETGYDGGPFFSPDGRKIGFRASRPQEGDELEKYKQLLSYNLVEPLAMELYTINVDGSGLRRLTDLGGSNWAPFYLPDNKRLIFSTNFNHSGAEFGLFDLYVVGENGKSPERITYNKGFDAFPMPSHNGQRLIWGSSRNGKTAADLNLFVADWKK